MARFLILCLVSCGLLTGACQTGGGEAQQAPERPLALHKVEDPQIPHLIETGGRVLSGAAPEGDASFAALAARGVKTIVSVDGARPEVAGAARHGMRYVHIPFGYDGIDPLASAQIVAVMQATSGPIYFHCHHGKHRGPAAAALALRAETGCSGEVAAELMRLAETEPKYLGLWSSVNEPLPVLNARSMPELHEVAPVGDLPAIMARLDREWDNVEILKRAAWSATAEHPDLDPVQQARIAAETLESCSQALSPELAVDADFLERLRAQQSDARALQAALERHEGDAATAIFDRMKRGCVSCHDDYRN